MYGSSQPYKGEPRAVINIRPSPRPSYISDCTSHAPQERPHSDRPNQPLPLLILDLNGTLLNRQTKGAGGRGNVTEKSKRPIRRPFLANFLQYALGWEREEAVREIQREAAQGNGKGREMEKGEGQEGEEATVDEGSLTREQLWERWQGNRERIAYGQGLEPAPKPHGSIFWNRSPQESSGADSGGGSSSSTSSAHVSTASPSTTTPETWRSHPREPLASPRARYRLLVWSSAQSHNVQSMVKAMLDPSHAAQLLRVWARETLVPSRRFRDKVGSLKDLEIAWGALNVERSDVDGKDGEVEFEGEKRLWADYRDEMDSSEGNALNRGEYGKGRWKVPLHNAGDGAGGKDKRRWKVRRREERERQEKIDALVSSDDGRDSSHRGSTPGDGESEQEAEKTASHLAAEDAAAFVVFEGGSDTDVGAGVEEIKGRKRNSSPLPSGNSGSTSHSSVSPRGYGPHNTLLLDDSASKAALQPYNHLLVPEFDDDRATRVRDLRHQRDEALSDLEDLYMERAEIQQVLKRLRLGALKRQGMGRKEGVGEAEVKEEEAKKEMDERLGKLEKEEELLIEEIESFERGIERTDDVLLQCVGVLEHARRFRHVGRWVADGGLGAFGGLKQVGVRDGEDRDGRMEKGRHDSDSTSSADAPSDEDKDEKEIKLDLDRPSHRRDQRFWAKEGRKALRLAGVRIDCE